MAVRYAVMIGWLVVTSACAVIIDQLWCLAGWAGGNRAQDVCWTHCCLTGCRSRHAQRAIPRGAGVGVG